MAYPVSLATLSERTLQRANLEGASTFIKPYELADLINGSIAEWVDEVRGTTWNGTYSRSSHVIDTSNGRQTYPLPQDFLSLISADATIVAGTPVITMRPYQEEERNAYRNYPLMGNWGFAQPIFYQLQDSNISFIPIPQGEYEVTIYYIPTAPILSDPKDEIDSINGWEEFIVLDAAIKCLMKVGGPEQIPALADRLERQRMRIRAMAPRRDQQAAERVHVVENAGYFGAGGDGWDW